MNIRKYGWKILSASKVGKFKFEIAGFADHRFSEAAVYLNRGRFPVTFEFSEEFNRPNWIPKTSEIAWSGIFSVQEDQIESGYNEFTLVLDDISCLPECWAPQTPAELFVPERSHLMRVSGPLANETQYRNSGRTEWRRLSNVLTEVKPQYNRVLDWGVGCARVSQHVSWEPAVSVTLVLILMKLMCAGVIHVYRILIVT